VAIDFSTVLAHAVKAATPVTPAATAPAADPAHVAQFRASLDSVSPSGSADISGALPMPAASVAPSATAGSSSAPAPSGTAPPSLGDAILNGLDHLRGHLKAGWASAVAPLEGGPVSAAGMLQAQAGLQQMGFETQLIATVAGKTSQSIDQLVKMQ
jgi:type III secretion system YscI/HrpB-like protein